VRRTAAFGANGPSAIEWPTLSTGPGEGSAPDTVSWRSGVSMADRVSRDDARSVPAVIKEIDVLWITAGLGCDGETIALTGASQPSLEEIVLGAMPWAPKINFRNPLLARRWPASSTGRRHRRASTPCGPACGSWKCPRRRDGMTEWLQFLESSKLARSAAGECR
jgi:hypothetical protein